MRLNKYISNSGICTRREADELINSGNIKVNNITIVELGYRIKKNDIVTLNEREVKHNKSIYILINKPKNYLMENNDNFKGRSLRSIISNACEDYLHPTQYLNEMDTGLILYTNNKKLIEKFSRSENKIKEIYQVTLEQSLEFKDFKKIKNLFLQEEINRKRGVIAYVKEDEKMNKIGIETYLTDIEKIKNLFCSINCSLSIDRVYFAGLTKKDLPRKKYRHLTQEEINLLMRI